MDAEDVRESSVGTNGNQGDRDRADVMGDDHDSHQFEDVLVPAVVAGDKWMHRCATSAAQFNSRLIQRRPRGFLDIHTNVEQVARSTQPSLVGVQLELGSERMGMVVDAEPLLAGPHGGFDGWVDAGDDGELSKFPVALMPGQFRGVYSL